MKKGLIVLVAMFLPMSLFGSTERIYAWGYGSSLNEALQALKGLTSEADYIIKSALAIAVLVFSISKALDSKSSPVWEIGKLVLLYGIVYHFFLSPSNNTYVIHDEVSGNDYKVSKLPSGLGNTVSLMSRLEKVILDGMEKHYSTPNSIAYSKAGLGFSLSAMMDIPTLRITRKDALMQSNMNYYVKSCYSNNLGIRIHQNSVLNSSDLAQTILLEKDGKLVYWQQDDGNGGIKSSIISCGEAATMIKKGFLNVADLMQNETAIKNVIVADYLDKFQNVAQLYFGQAAGSREQFQQILVMNALDDGIINTAKMLGLNPQSFAANTAIADQTITTSMQSQGRLAQTYLPLAKAYMTIIIISVSWLMAIISIMFGSYTHIKMFFTLCLTMVLWTPILSIINFLNDLNIQHTFGVINQNDAAFTYSNYKEVIQKVTANSNFLNYLVMLTPMLAYALAKGSEMGFVSIASSLSQQLAGASRAASSFATQQALSTSTAISSPDGSMVSSLAAGRREDVWAASVGGSVVGMSNTGTLGGMLNESGTTAGGSSYTQNAGGLVTAASIKGFGASDVSAMTKNIQETASNSLDNLSSTAEGRQMIAAAVKQVGSTTTHDKGIGVDDSFGSSTNKTSNDTTTHTDSESTTKSIWASISGKASGWFGGGNKDGNAGGSLSAEVGVGAKIQKDYKTDDSIQNSQGEGRTYSDDFKLNETEKAALMQNKAFIAALQDQVNTSTSQETRQSIQNLKSYSEVASFAQNWSVDSTATMVQNYMNTNSCSAADAVVALEQAAATKDYATISKYTGVADNSGINGSGIAQAQGIDHFNPNGVIRQHGINAGQALAAGQTRVVKDPETGQEKVVSGEVASAYTNWGVQTLDNTQGKAGIPNVAPNDFNHPANKYKAISDTTYTNLVKINPSIVNNLPDVKTSILNKGDNRITKGF